MDCEKVQSLNSVGTWSDMWATGVKKVSSFGSKMIVCSRGKVRIYGGLVPLSSVLGFLVLFFGTLAWKDRFFHGVGATCIPSLSTVYNVFVVIFLLFLSYRVYYLSFKRNEPDKCSGKYVNEFCPDSAFCAFCGAKIKCLKNCPTENSKGRGSRIGRSRFKHLVDDECNGGGGGGGGNEDGGGFDEDQVEYITKLWKKVTKERKLRATATAELEKERNAAASASNEAMTKILLLQNEKGLVEREARQYREMAEQRQWYDNQVIDSLHWVIRKLEAERGDMIMEVAVEDKQAREKEEAEEPQNPSTNCNASAL